MLRNTGARKSRSKNQEMPPPTRKAEVGTSATSVGVRSTLCTSTVACAEVLSTEHDFLKKQVDNRKQAQPSCHFFSKSAQ